MDVGSGVSVRFWKDLCWDSIPLISAFPRIYALATNKGGMVGDFWRWMVLVGNGM